MAATPPDSSTVSNPLTTHHVLLDTLTSFLTVATHHILYLRRIYPPVSFASIRAYNYPVRQNRHPEVCAWINDAVAAVRDQMERNTVDKIALCIFECKTNQVLERWTIDLHAFPFIEKIDQDVPLVNSDDPELSCKINWTDLEADFRATLSRISHSASKLRPLPEGDNAPECSFTITIEVKENVERPVGRTETLERRWMAAEPDHFADNGKDQPNGSSSNNNKNNNKNPKADKNEHHTAKTHPVRRLEAGEMRLEVWVEESAAKFSYPLTQLSASERNGYGAGSKKFDPEVGYELERPDINRKPGGGIGTDYQRG